MLHREEEERRRGISVGDGLPFFFGVDKDEQHSKYYLYTNTSGGKTTDNLSKLRTYSQCLAIAHCHQIFVLTNVLERVDKEKSV